MSFLTLGAVSNCWSALLPDTSLAEQCRRAVDAGYGYVELRQRAMAECEEAVAGDARPWPVPSALADLRDAFPDLGMNLALEAPFFTSPLDVEDAYFLRCIEAAKALTPEAPVLRFVDLSPAAALLDDEEIDTLGQSVAALAARLNASGVGLALENSKQPVERLVALIGAALQSEPYDIPSPRICWDPHNQISQTLAVEDPLHTATTLDIDTLFEFHFKQAIDGVLQGDVGEGDIDWNALVNILRRRGYHGPALFEIPAGPDIWDRLERSTRYIQSLVSDLTTELTE